jgi:alpha-glucoside transport system substrate-binding protein
VGATNRRHLQLLPFPTVDPEYARAVVGAGDLFGIFHDTPAAKWLMRYLVTAEAQDIRVRLGGALSANRNATAYPDDLSRGLAQVPAYADTFVFDASDLMPTAMNDASRRPRSGLHNREHGDALR